MEKIDFEEVKRLTRIRDGKEVAPSRYEKKLAETIIKMDLTDIERQAEELKKKLTDLPVEVKPMAKGQFLMNIRNLNPDPGTEIKRFLFAFKGKFHLIEADKYRKIEDGEVRMLLDEHQDTKLFYICTNANMCPLPPAFVMKNAEAVKLKNDAEVIAYIKKVTGVTIKLK